MKQEKVAAAALPRDRQTLLKRDFVQRWPDTTRCRRQKQQIYLFQKEIKAPF